MRFKIIWFTCHNSLSLSCLKIEWEAVHETPILEVIFLTLTENSSVITNNEWHPGTSEISTSPEIAVGMHFYVRTWHYNYPSVFTCWWRSLFVATSTFSLLTIRRHSATRKHLLLYPEGDWSGLTKPKKG